MPELPDLTVYLEALERRVGGRRLDRIELRSPFVLRTVEPRPEEAESRRVVAVRRVGKRLALGMERGPWLVIHLMIAGRLQWATSVKPSRSRTLLARFHFETGVLSLTEAGTKKRASLHVLADTSALEAHAPGGLEVLECSLPAFAERLRSENHTLKRALTDPRLFSGIGNAYSDEILHAARLAPTALSQQLDDARVARLHAACVKVLTDWTATLRAQTGDAFPRKVTAFRPGMAVHGRYGEPCPACGTRVQRVRYADNEMNYCPRCQTDGRLLKDRSLSRLLKSDWPRTIDELENPSR